VQIIRSRGAAGKAANLGGCQLEAQTGAMPYMDTMRSLELVGRDVIPQLQKR
jgi:hypothetical protein